MAVELREGPNPQPCNKSQGGPQNGSKVQSLPIEIQTPPVDGVMRRVAVKQYWMGPMTASDSYFETNPFIEASRKFHGFLFTPTVFVGIGSFLLTCPKRINMFPICCLFCVISPKGHHLYFKLLAEILWMTMAKLP